MDHLYLLQKVFTKSDQSPNRKLRLRFTEHEPELLQAHLEQLPLQLPVQARELLRGEMLRFEYRSFARCHVPLPFG